MPKTILVLGLLAVLLGCQPQPGHAAPPSASPPCCHESLDAAPVQTMSIYNLETPWRNQAGQVVRLKQFQGQVVCLAMIYASCKNACPRIIADMRALEKELAGKGVRFVLVSMDPEMDTPARLQKLARTSHLGPDWTLLTGTRGDVTELSAVLGVKIRKISATDYAHTNLISILDRQGVVVHRQEGLGVKPAASVAAVNRLLGK